MMASNPEIMKHTEPKDTEAGKKVKAGYEEHVADLVRCGSREEDLAEGHDE